VSVEVRDESGVPVDLDELRRQAEFLLAQLGIHPEAELSLLLLDEAAMSVEHQRWMHEPGPTDVMAFPMDEMRSPREDEPAEPGLLGDVVICPQVAARQARDAGHSTGEELGLLLTHGVLHLLGHDHAEPDEHAEMFALQGRLLTAWTAARHAAGGPSA
jgi:probable rRNA maturation factor